jgi:hypothetical protein
MVSHFLFFVCCGCSVHHLGVLSLGRVHAVTVFTVVSVSVISTYAQNVKYCMRDTLGYGTVLKQIKCITSVVAIKLKFSEVWKAEQVTNYLLLI